MNIKKVNGSRKERTIIFVLVFLIVGVTLILVTSMAKYKSVQTIELANGIINYVPADIDIVAVYQQNDSGEYEMTNTVPTSGYTLSDKSYCNANGVKDTNVVLTYQDGKLGVSNISKKVKCYLYFDKGVMTAIGNIVNADKKIEFTGIATVDDTGIYEAPDDYGTSYYFRGL